MYTNQKAMLGLISDLQIPLLMEGFASLAVTVGSDDENAISSSNLGIFVVRGLLRKKL